MISVVDAAEILSIYDITQLCESCSNPRGGRNLLIEFQPLYGSGAKVFEELRKVENPGCEDQL